MEEFNLRVRKAAKKVDLRDYVISNKKQFAALLDALVDAEYVVLINVEMAQ